MSRTKEQYTKYQQGNSNQNIDKLGKSNPPELWIKIIINCICTNFKFYTTVNNTLFSVIIHSKKENYIHTVGT